MARRPSSRLMPERPIVGRFFLILLSFILFLLSPRNAGAQAVVPPSALILTESDAVSRAVGRAPLSETIEGSISIERGGALAAGAYPNPQISYLREQTFGGLGTEEDYLSLAQVIDLGNRRGLRRDAGAHRAVAAKHEGETTRAQVATEARQRFFEALYRERRVAILQAWAVRLDTALTIVARRTASGDAALYDQRRLQRESAVAQGRLATERAARDRALARLRSIADLPAVGTALVLQGELLPDSEPADTALLRERAERRPDLLALKARLQAAQSDRTSAGRWWLPDLRLEGGWKGVNLGQQGRTDGFLLGVTLTLPFWDSLSGLALTAEGEAQLARGRHALLLTELDGELTGLRAETSQLRQAAIHFREQTRAASAELVRIATAGYHGGELSVLELLDAYRGASDDELTALEMAHAARRARIELERISAASRAEVP